MDILTVVNDNFVDKLGLAGVVIAFQFILIIYLLWRDGRLRHSKDNMIVKQAEIVSKLTTAIEILKESTSNELSNIYKSIHDINKYALIGKILAEERPDLESITNKDLADIIKNKTEKIKNQFK